MICQYCNHEFNANYTYSKIFCSEFCSQQGKEQMIDLDMPSDEGYAKAESENDCYD